MYLKDMTIKETAEELICWCNFFEDNNEYSNEIQDKISEIKLSLEENLNLYNKGTLKEEVFTNFIKEQDKYIKDNLPDKYIMERPNNGIGTFALFHNEGWKNVRNVFRKNSPIEYVNTTTYSYNVNIVRRAYCFDWYWGNEDVNTEFNFGFYLLPSWYKEIIKDFNSRFKNIKIEVVYEQPVYLLFTNNEYNYSFNIYEKSDTFIRCISARSAVFNIKFSDNFPKLKIKYGRYIIHHYIRLLSLLEYWNIKSGSYIYKEKVKHDLDFMLKLNECALDVSDLTRAFSEMRNLTEDMIMSLDNLDSWNKSSFASICKQTDIIFTVYFNSNGFISKDTTILPQYAIIRKWSHLNPIFRRIKLLKIITSDAQYKVQKLLYLNKNIGIQILPVKVIADYHDFILDDVFKKKHPRNFMIDTYKLSFLTEEEKDKVLKSDTYLPDIGTSFNPRNECSKCGKDLGLGAEKMCNNCKSGHEVCYICNSFYKPNKYKNDFHICTYCERSFQHAFEDVIKRKEDKK
jgi:hypothetical protein